MGSDGARLDVGAGVRRIGTGEMMPEGESVVALGVESDLCCGVHDRDSV